MQLNVLNIKNLKVIFNNNIILDDINLAVKQGDLLGILGPNGAGKTTLFKAILNLIKYDGEISMFGYKNQERVKVLPFISYLPQKTNIEQNFPATVYDLVSTAFLQSRYMNVNLIKRHGYEWNVIISKDEIHHALDIVGLRHKINVRIGRLSGGELQRALIAKALIAKTPLLILDEPFTALDVNAKTTLFDILKMLNEKLKITVILAAHELLLLMKLANKIACINKRLFFHGSKECLNDEILKLYSESAMHLHMQDHI